MAWSIFEAKCFAGYLKAGCLRKFARRVCSEGFKVDAISAPVAHFHQRYKDGGTLGNLLHDKKTLGPVVSEFKRCISTPLSDLGFEDQVFLVSFVVYRFRNNMFHGNKRVQSWLRFREQISLCTFSMQQFVLHSESVIPTMQVARAA